MSIFVQSSPQFKNRSVNFWNQSRKKRESHLEDTVDAMLNALVEIREKFKGASQKENISAPSIVPDSRGYPENPHADNSKKDASSPYFILSDTMDIVTVDKPILVKSGEIFDGGHKLYEREDESVRQSEKQAAVFILQPGATVKNLQYRSEHGIQLQYEVTGIAENSGDYFSIPGDSGLVFNRIIQLNHGGSFYVLWTELRHCGELYAIPNARPIALEMA
jgi:hypothetical protein